MSKLFFALKIYKNGEIDLDSLALYVFVSINEIHPFLDGNGSVARLMYALLSDDELSVITLFERMGESEDYLVYLRSCDTVDDQGVLSAQLIQAKIAPLKVWLKKSSAASLSKKVQEMSERKKITNEHPNNIKQLELSILEMRALHYNKLLPNPLYFHFLLMHNQQNPNATEKNLNLFDAWLVGLKIDTPKVLIEETRSFIRRNILFQMIKQLKDAQLIQNQNGVNLKKNLKIKSSSEKVLTRISQRIQKTFENKFQFYPKTEYIPFDALLEDAKKDQPICAFKAENITKYKEYISYILYTLPQGQHAGRTKCYLYLAVFCVWTQLKDTRKDRLSHIYRAALVERSMIKSACDDFIDQSLSNLKSTLKKWKQEEYYGSVFAPETVKQLLPWGLISSTSEDDIRHGAKNSESVTHNARPIKRT